MFFLWFYLLCFHLVALFHLKYEVLVICYGNVLCNNNFVENEACKNYTILFTQ